MQQTFRSKIDAWLFVLLLAFLAAQVYFLVDIMPPQAWDMERYIAIVIVVAVFLLVGGILLRTYYTVDEKELKIHCGPFRWTIDLAEITSVAETRSVLSSPALSLDRIRIHYGDRRWVMVSPADKQSFCAAIGHMPAPGRERH